LEIQRKWFECWDCWAIVLQKSLPSILGGKWVSISRWIDWGIGIWYIKTPDAKRLRKCFVNSRIKYANLICFHKTKHCSIFSNKSFRFYWFFVEMWIDCFSFLKLYSIAQYLCIETHPKMWNKCTRKSDFLICWTRWSVTAPCWACVWTEIGQNWGI